MSKAAVFLNRDGPINVERNHFYGYEDLTCTLQAVPKLGAET